MYSCIKSFMDNDKENGLLLLDMPTGFGKTYSVIKYIAEFIKENSDTGKKIFFITTLKKNLPVEELKRRLDEMELLHLFEERVIELKSNVDTVVANYNSSMYNDIPLEIRNSEEFKNFKADVEFLSIQGKILTLSAASGTTSPTTMSAFSERICKILLRGISLQLKKDCLQ